MRSYDVGVTSLVVGSTVKWTDNLLTQHSVTDVISARRGVARRITHSALIRIALIRELHLQLGVSVADGVRIAAQILDTDPPGVYASGHLTIAVDLAAFSRDVAHRLASALESAPAPRRGRPPGKRRM